MSQNLVRSARARRRSLRAAAVARPPCGCDARQSVRAFRRWKRMDLSPDAGDRAPDRHRPRRTRRAARRPRAVVAAQRARCDPHLVRPQLSRRGLCADQSRLSRRPAGACRRQLGREADRGACRSRRPAGRHRSRGADDGGRAERRGARDSGPRDARARRAPACRWRTCRRSRATIAPWDTQSIIYTSGTTGPRRACWRRTCISTRWAPIVPLARPDDRFMVNLPLFHVGGTVASTRCWRSAARSPSSRRSTPRRSGRSSPRPAPRPACCSA